MRLTTGSLLLLATVLAVSPARGADIKEVAPIKVGDQEVQKITLSGRIETGDAEKLDDLISDDGYTVVRSTAMAATTRRPWRSPRFSATTSR